MTDTERKEVELKPCPFCKIEMSEFSGGNFGHKVAIDKHGGESECILRGQLFDVNEREKWNKRPQDNDLVSLDKAELQELLCMAEDEYIHNNPHGFNRRHFIIEMICAKFGKDNNAHNEQPPKERKVSLEEIFNIIDNMLHGYSKTWKTKVAQAILSLLNATEERKGAE